MVEERVTHLISLVGVVSPDACCAGAAGAEVPTGRARLESLLRRLLPESRICVVHDSRLVLAAAGLDSGIALVAGTGSVAYGRAPDSREVQVGGWGWLLGDEGSGVWITREAARLVLARTDTRADRGVLGDTLVDALGVDDARELTPALLAMHEPMEWAALASVVFETANDDVGARDIIDRAGKKLARLVLQVEGALGLRAPVVLAGGLLLNQPLLEDAVRTNLPGREFVRLEQPPVVGAVRIAEEMLRS